MIFFKDILPEFSEIIYFEHDRPECSNCGFEMNDNGSRESKPNKQKGIRKKQYICLKCGKTHLTSLEPFISRYSNYSYDICERGLNYDYIAYLSYDKKRELINFENNIKIARQTIYYHESTYDKTFLKRQEEINQKLLKERGIEPTGYYHYDEVRQDRAFSPITSVKFFNLKDFNPCCLGFPPSKFLSW